MQAMARRLASGVTADAVLYVHMTTTVKFLRDTKRPTLGTIIPTPSNQPNIVRCDNYRLFKKGKTASVNVGYLSGLIEGTDYEIR
jgi:hypothetical protein